MAALNVSSVKRLSLLGLIVFSCNSYASCFYLAPCFMDHEIRQTESAIKHKVKLKKKVREREERRKTKLFRGNIIPLIDITSIRSNSVAIKKKKRQQTIDEIENGKLWNGRKVKLSRYAPIINLHVPIETSDFDGPPWSP